jgi:putative membrane protein
MIDLVSGSVEKIESGASNLSSNLSKLETGIKELSVGADSLASGVSLVDNGAKTLHSGVSKLNKEGISVFVNYKNRLKDYSNKLEAMVELSDSYSGYTSNNATTTTFVYTISSLKK